MDLNDEQRDAVDCDGNVVVTACPGSGKTRVLTARVVRGISQLASSRHRIAALTYTNRAADEIRARLDGEGVPSEQLWAGTIHSFALEWILRPFAPYMPELRYGFTVADEYRCEQFLREIRQQLGLPFFTDINTSHNRDGTVFNDTEETVAALQLYKEKLREAKLIDYEEVLHLAYQLLSTNPEIAANLGSLFRVFCVDEVQDVQDLQFGILSEIYRQAEAPPQMFFVGDSDQSIYDSLGALAKTPEEISEEFGMPELKHHKLVGNYRSTQRIVDYCRLFRPNVTEIESRVAAPEEPGSISFSNQILHKDELCAQIALIVERALGRGVEQKEICILAPRWNHVRAIARSLVETLPQVNFDAPGLSPLYSARDSVWYKLARLFLTNPEPSRIRSRFRCASEVIVDLAFLLGSEVPDRISSPRRLLRLVNQLESMEDGGLRYLEDVFAQFLSECRIDLDAHKALHESHSLFFEKASGRLGEDESDMPTSVESLRKLFKSPAGVVVNTCHGVKGEEFDTVIAFGLLRGYVPHWSVIFNGVAGQADERESKLLYVVASRAKRHLHLIAEQGRLTTKGSNYQTSWLLDRIAFGYDSI